MNEAESDAGSEWDGWSEVEWSGVEAERNVGSE